MLQLTTKPLLLSEEIQILSDWGNITIGEGYFGTVVSENKFVYTILFFNGIKGTTHLTYSQF